MGSQAQRPPNHLGLYQEIPRDSSSGSAWPGLHAVFPTMTQVAAAWPEMASSEATARFSTEDVPTGVWLEAFLQKQLDCPCFPSISIWLEDIDFSPPHGISNCANNTYECLFSLCFSVLKIFYH